LLQQLEQQVALITLDFYHPILDRTTGTAALFQFLGQFFKLLRFQIQAGDQGDAFALSPFGLTLNPDDSIAFMGGLAVFAGTGFERITTIGAEAAMLIGIHGSAVVHGDESPIMTGGA